MARILILSFTEIAKDPRVLRHIEALRGHHTVVTCGKGPAPDGVSEHHEIPWEAVNVPKDLGVIVNLALRRSKAAYRGSQTANAVRTLLADVPFDAMLANDLLAVPVALDVAGKRPVVADLHEYAPSQLDSSPRWRLMIKPLMDALCRDCLPRAAAITTVCDGIAAEYRRGYGVDVQTVTNAAPCRSPEPRPAGSPVRVVHTGLAAPSRRLEVMMTAVDGLPGVELDLFLLALPDSARYLVELKAQAAASANVRVLDPVPMREIPGTLDGYDVGVFVYPPSSFNSKFTLPNKFFDFVQSGLGIIVGPSPEMAALTQRHSLGLVLDDFEVSTLRAALSSLDPTAVAEWKTASCAAAQALGSESQAQRLRDIVAGVVEPPSNG